MKIFILTLCLFFSTFVFASASRVLDGATITNGANTLTIPAATDTLVGKATTDTFTNKSISGLTNTLTSVPAGTAITGQLPIANGGTNATTANAALNNLLPTQSSSSGKYLTTNGTDTSWSTVASGAPGTSGTDPSPTLITTAGITFSGSAYDNFYFIAGNGGAITVTANPQITTATNVGQKLFLIGRHAVSTVTLNDGNGLSLNGVWVGGLDSVLELFYNGATWVEISRR